METQPCSRCGVQIHPASRRCTLCGSVQTTPTRRSAGLGWLAGVAGLAAIVVAVGVLTGAGSKPGGPRFRLLRTSALSTLVPVGWVGRPHTAAAGTARVVFYDPRQPDFELS